jgi:uncharacterized protein
MIGTIINIVAIIVGSLIGVVAGNRLPPRIQQAVLTGLGLVVVVVGMQNALITGNIVVPLLSIVIGAIIGEILDIDAALKRSGAWLQTRAAAMSQSGNADDARVRFINGFVTASLVFCVGPLAIIGSVRNGISPWDVQLLVIKSVLDFFASIAFAASLGIGVAFSVIPTLILQGGFALVGFALALLVGGSAADTMTDPNPYIRELTATGGLLLMGIALILLDIKQVRVANYLPALIIAPLLVLIAAILGINVYPLG